MIEPTAGADLNRGRLLTMLLCQSWRRDVRPAPLSREELDAILPLALRNGTAALAWRRIRGTALAMTKSGWRLRNGQLSIATYAAAGEAALKSILALDGLSDADPILVKGWTHARLYPAQAMRPYSDVDLFVAPERYQRLMPALETGPAVELAHVLPMDVQTEWVDLDRSWDEIRAHSRVAFLGSAEVRVLGPEDALRLCCLHVLRHATELPPRSNPLWLCDVSVMLEDLSPDFDWDYCTAGQPWRTQWMFTVIRLANQVLGARVDQSPGGRLQASVPPWLTKVFLRIWGHAEGDRTLWPQPLPLGRIGRDIRALREALAERWANPLRSVYRLSWPINQVSGPVAQIVDYPLRAVAWGRRHAGSRKEKVAIV